MIGVSFGPFPDVGAPDWIMKLNKASIRVNKEFSMLLSPVIRKFVNTNQLSITNSEYIDSNNLNTSVGNMSTNTFYKEGERPLYIVDLHYDQTHPDIIYRLFNGKEIKFTPENQDFLMYLAQTLKISALKRSLANFIKFGESQTVKDLKEIGRLISEFSEETFDDVYNFLLKYLQSDDENAVKQSYFVAFMIFNGCVARPVRMELFVKLADKLNVLKEFAKVCIYNYKNKENLQESLFLIRHLLSRAEAEAETEEEENNQSNQKKNNYLSVTNSVTDGKKSLVFSDLSLSQKNVDPKNNNGFSNDSSDNDENEEEKVTMLQIFTENFTPLELSSFKLHKEYAETGVNNDPIAMAVRNDDVSIFTDETKVNRKIINFSTYCVKPSLYERSTIINNSNEDVNDDNSILKRGIKYTGVPLVCYAAYFGSIECFNYLVNEINVEIPSNLTRYAVCGGNSEILEFCHKRMRPLESKENAENQSMTTIFNNYFGQPKTENQEENNDNHSQNEDEKENQVQEEEEKDGEQLSEELKVCVFDTRCLELASIFQRFEAFKFLDEVIQIPITDSVIDTTIKHFSFEVFVHILSKPGFDLNSLFLRSTKYSNEEAASLMSEFCDSYCIQEEDTLKTPLHYACEFGLSKIVKILIEKVKPSLKLKCNFDDDETQSQINEEEEENSNIQKRDIQLQFEEEEEEHQIIEEEEVEDGKARQVRFELDQNEQREFDQEIQKGIIEQTSSEQVIHPIENEEEQQQESPENNNQAEDEINIIDREINLEVDQQQQEEFEPEQAEQQQEEESVPETEQAEQQQQEFEQEPEERPDELISEPEQTEQRPDELISEPEQTEQRPDELISEPEQTEPQQEENEQVAEEQIQHQLQLMEEQQLEQIESDHENQPEQEEIQSAEQEPAEPIETPEDQYAQNNNENADVQERDVQLELEVEEEEVRDQQQQQDENQQQQEEPNPTNNDQIEEEEEEATEILIDDLADKQQQQQQPETEPTNNENGESTEPNIEINLNERTEETNDQIESNDLVIPRNNEEEEVNPIDGSEIEEENILFKNNSLIEGNNELDELETPEVAERGVELDGNRLFFGEEEEIIVQINNNNNNHPEEEEMPPITFSPSDTSDDDEFINNISGFNTANQSNINLVSPRSLNLSSNMMSRSVILTQNSVDLNAKDADNVTPLQLACKEGWLNIVKMFAQLDYEEIEYDAVSDYEKNALQFAQEASHHKIVNLLKKIMQEQSQESSNNSNNKIEATDEIIIDDNNNDFDDQIIQQAEE